MRCPGCHHLNLEQVERCARCGRVLPARPTATSQFWSGLTLLGRYHLGPLLGEGAAGQVFQTHDRVLGRTIALKILKPELWQSAKARERMAREAGALGRITHPNVVGIHNVFEHESALILELELVDGGTLADRLSGGPLPLPEAQRVMAGILGGLGAIHDAGIVHRDIKPANILLTGDGTPKIADLGVARDMTALPMTGTGTKLGTMEYMSPEQIREEPVGPATDIYACGILVCELVTGAIPFDGVDEFAADCRSPPAAPQSGAARSQGPARDGARGGASARQGARAPLGIRTRARAGLGHGQHSSPGKLSEPAEVSPPPPPHGTSSLKVVAVLIVAVLFLGVLVLGVLFIGYLRFGGQQWLPW